MIALLIVSISVGIEMSTGIALIGGLQYPEYVEDIYDNNYSLELVDTMFGPYLSIALNNTSLNILWLHSGRDEVLYTAKSTTEDHLNRYGDINVDNSNSYYQYNDLSFMLNYNIGNDVLLIKPQIGYKWNEFNIHVNGFNDGISDEYIDYYKNVHFVSVGSEFEIILERHHIGFGVNYEHSFGNNVDAFPLSIMYKIESTNSEGEVGMFSAAMYGQYDLLDNWTKYKLYGIFSYNISF